jgi:hypothetical protein
VREGRLTKHPEPTVASSPELREGSQIADAVSASGGQEAAEGGRADEASRLGEAATGPHLSAGNRFDFLDSRRNLHSVQRKHSMSNSKGMDPIHLRQLRAIAENLCTQANRHRENHNYLVAHALYGRALCGAQEIHTPENAPASRFGNVVPWREWCGESSVGQGAEGWSIEFISEPEAASIKERSDQIRANQAGLDLKVYQDRTEFREKLLMHEESRNCN